LEERFITKKQLADILQVTERSIDNWIKDKIITPVKGLPVIRFSPKYIAELQGVQLTEFSPLERRKLLKELEEVTRERDKLRSDIAKINSISTESLLYRR
jgi:transcriptional antiterminator